MSRLLLVGEDPGLAATGRRLAMDVAKGEAEALCRVREYPYAGVILSPAFSQPELVSRLRLLISAGPAQARIVTVVEGAQDSSRVRDLFRAGAADVWGSGEVTKAALESLLRQQVGRAGTVAACTAPKGGTGCSTLLLHALRPSGGSTLVIDLSPVSLHRFCYDLSPLHYLQALQPHLDHLGAEEVRSVAVAAPRGPHYIFVDPRQPLNDPELLQLLPPLIAVARGLWNLVVLEIPGTRCHLGPALIPHLDRICWVTTPDVPCLQAMREVRLSMSAWAGEGTRSQGVVVNRCGGTGAVSPDDLGRVAGLPVVSRIPSDFEALDQARLERPRYPRALARALEHLRDALLVGW